MRGALLLGDLQSGILIFGGIPGTALEEFVIRRISGVKSTTRRG